MAAREAIPRDKMFLAGTGQLHAAHDPADEARGRDRRRRGHRDHPHYFTKGFSQAAAQVRHYMAVAEASPIPVMLDHFPPTPA